MEDHSASEHSYENIILQYTFKHIYPLHISGANLIENLPIYLNNNDHRKMYNQKELQSEHSINEISLLVHPIQDLEKYLTEERSLDIGFEKIL